MRIGFMTCILLGAIIYLPSAASAAAKTSTVKSTSSSESAADFPPGMFTDGGHYRLEDFRGKVVVLYFGCNICPRNRASVAERNKVVEQFRDKPVRFLAITPVAMTEAKDYATATKLEMPCFADALGVMQYQYGTSISLNNIWQIRVVNPEGKVIGYDMSASAIESAIKDVKWKYKDDGYDPKLSGIVDALEWNQFIPAAQALRPLLKQKTKTADSARALYEKFKTTDGAAWAAEADTATDDPVKAFDLYTRIAACFPDDPMGKHATESIKKLKTDKAVISELAARSMYDRLATAISKATPTQKPQVMSYCESITQRYPEAPTGKAAAALSQQLAQAKIAE